MRKKTKAKKGKEKENVIDGNVLAFAYDLAKTGVATEVIENYITKKTRGD